MVTARGAGLEDICAYIARDSETYARLFGQRIMALIETIPDAPLLGAVVPEYQRQDLRERIFQNYRVVYRTRENFAKLPNIGRKL